MPRGWNKGLHLSEEQKQKMVTTRRRNRNYDSSWNKGVKWKQEIKSKISKAMKGKIRNITGRRMSNGYWKIRLPGAPIKWVAEHRILIENKIGRKLLENEHVHHLNGIKNDNRIENLQILTPSAHQKLHASKQIHKPHKKATKLKISKALKENWKNGKYNNFKRWEKIREKADKCAKATALC